MLPKFCRILIQRVNFAFHWLQRVGSYKHLTNESLPFLENSSRLACKKAVLRGMMEEEDILNSAEPEPNRSTTPPPRLIDHYQEGSYVPSPELDRERKENRRRLKSRFEAIFQKYAQDFTGVGDEIDLETGEVIVDNGHITRMTHEVDTGIGGAVSCSRIVANDHSDTSEDEGSIYDSDDYTEISVEENDDEESVFGIEPVLEGLAFQARLNAGSTGSAAGMRSSVLDPALPNVSSGTQFGSLKTPQHTAMGLSQTKTNCCEPREDNQFNATVDAGSSARNDNIVDNRVKESTAALNVFDQLPDLRQSILDLQSRSQAGQAPDHDAIQALSKSIGYRLAQFAAFQGRNDNTPSGERKRRDRGWDYPELPMDKRPRRRLSSSPGLIEQDRSTEPTDHNDVGMKRSVWAPNGPIRKSRRPKHPQGAENLVGNADQYHSADGKKCSNCLITFTSSWRKSPHGNLCNPCWMFHYRYGGLKPIRSPSPSFQDGLESGTKHYRANTSRRVSNIKYPEFTSVEDALIIKLKEIDELTWENIGRHFPRRSAFAVQNRYSKRLAGRPCPGRDTLISQGFEVDRGGRVKLRNGKFTRRQDAELFQLRFDKQLDWDEIAQRLTGGHTAGAIQQRFDVLAATHSDHGDGVDGDTTEAMYIPKTRLVRFTAEEDEEILKLRDEEGLAWSEIAAFFPERSAGALQKRYTREIAFRKTRPDDTQGVALQKEEASSQTGFSATDDANIVQFRDVDHMSWHMISKLFPHREKLSVISRYWHLKQISADNTSKDSARTRPGHTDVLQSNMNVPSHKVTAASTFSKLVTVSRDRNVDVVSAGFTGHRKDMMRKAYNDDEDDIIVKLKGRGFEWNHIQLYIPSRTIPSLLSRYRELRRKPDIVEDDAEVPSACPPGSPLPDEMSLSMVDERHQEAAQVLAELSVTSQNFPGMTTAGSVNTASTIRPLSARPAQGSTTETSVLRHTDVPLKTVDVMSHHKSLLTLPCSDSIELAQGLLPELMRANDSPMLEHDTAFSPRLDDLRERKFNTHDVLSSSPADHGPHASTPPTDASPAHRQIYFTPTRCGAYGMPYFIAPPVQFEPPIALMYGADPGLMDSPSSGPMFAQAAGKNLHDTSPQGFSLGESIQYEHRSNPAVARSPEHHVRQSVSRAKISSADQGTAVLQDPTKESDVIVASTRPASGCSPKRSVSVRRSIYLRGSTESESEADDDVDELHERVSKRSIAASATRRKMMASSRCSTVDPEDPDYVIQSESEDSDHDHDGGSISDLEVLTATKGSTIRINGSKNSPELRTARPRDIVKSASGNMRISSAKPSPRISSQTRSEFTAKRSTDETRIHEENDTHVKKRLTKPAEETYFIDNSVRDKSHSAQGHWMQRSTQQIASDDSAADITSKPCRPTSPLADSGSPQLLPMSSSIADSASSVEDLAVSASDSRLNAQQHASSQRSSLGSRPRHTTLELALIALLAAPSRQLTTRAIYQWLKEEFPCLGRRDADPDLGVLKKDIRSQLGSSAYFTKIQGPKGRKFWGISIEAYRDILNKQLIVKPYDGRLALNEFPAGIASISESSMLRETTAKVHKAASASAVPFDTEDDTTTDADVRGVAMNSMVHEQWSGPIASQPAPNMQSHIPGHGRQGVETLHSVVAATTFLAKHGPASSAVTREGASSISRDRVSVESESTPRRSSPSYALPKARQSLGLMSGKPRSAACNKNNVLKTPLAPSSRRVSTIGTPIVSKSQGRSCSVALPGSTRRVVCTPAPVREIADSEDELAL